ncbi:MAG TPA: alpha/beta fold hydrolase [Candidatus Saccharimonadales bacterium]|nr:alpha/beta fold hydrolase [Candidatus Saccharimonadales bacterium]
MKPVIVCSHGFGVRADDRGLFTDIQKGLGETAEVVMFDYYDFDDESNELIVKPFREQEKILEHQVDKVKLDFPGAPIIVVGHSQGCVIAAMADVRVKKMIMLTPAVNFNLERLRQNFADREGTIIDLDGITRLARRDGSMTFVPSEYWPEFNSVDPIHKYMRLEDETELVIVRATEDEVLGMTEFPELNNTRIIDIKGDHNLSGDARAEVVDVIKKEIK